MQSKAQAATIQPLTRQQTVGQWLAVAGSVVAGPLILYDDFRYDHSLERSTTRFIIIIAATLIALIGVAIFFSADTKK